MYLVVFTTFCFEYFIFWLVWFEFNGTILMLHTFLFRLNFTKYSLNENSLYSENIIILQLKQKYRLRLYLQNL
jgi:hypothetical protein